MGEFNAHSGYDSSDAKNNEKALMATKGQ